MNSRMSAVFLLLGLLASSHAYFPGEIKRAVNENCEKLAGALEAYVSSFGEPVKCLISDFSTKLIGEDLTDREVLEELSCLVIENSASGADIFNALDNAGYIDKLFDVIYSWMAVMGRFGTTELLKQGLKAELSECHPELAPSFGTFAELSSDDFYRLYETMEELQIFTLTPEMSKEVWKLVDLVVHLGPGSQSAPPVPAPCQSSALTDSDLRCEKLNAATKPFYDAIEADQNAISSLQRVNSQIQLFTGVDLWSDFTADAQRIDCDIAKATSVGDYRTLLKNYGLLDVGFDLALGFGCYGLQEMKGQYQYLLDRYDNPEQNGYNWKPSEEMIAQAKVLSDLADAWIEVGLGSVELDIPLVPRSMIPSVCMAPAPSLKSFFNF